jgi:glycosyltransferase involved in cell wall biosynthesis
MKIGIVVDNELNNDIRVLREIRLLKEQGFEIFVLCFGFVTTYKDPVEQIHITRINIPKKVKDILFFMFNAIPLYEWFWAAKIKKFIIQNDVEYLHVHDLYMSRAAYKGIRKTNLKIPLILDLHENYPYTVRTYNWTKGFLRRLVSRPDEWEKKEKKYIEYADRIIVLSSEYKDLLLRRYPDLPEHVFTVLPNVPDLSQLPLQKIIPVESPFKQDFPVILYYGVIAERRGVFDSIEVFMNLVKENYKINFLFIGPVDKKDKTHFLKLINQELLAGKIYYIPWIVSNELPSYLQITDNCIAPFHKNPQHESGVANKIYEYMLGGKPLIVSDCMPQQNLVEKNNCGLVFRNMTEFRDAVIKLINDRELRSALGKNGMDAILREHNMAKVKENLISLYN